MNQSLKPKPTMTLVYDPEEGNANILVGIRHPIFTPDDVVEYLETDAISFEDARFWAHDEGFKLVDDFTMDAQGMYVAHLARIS